MNHNWIKHIELLHMDDIQDKYWNNVNQYDWKWLSNTVKNTVEENRKIDVKLNESTSRK